ncbi:MAG: phage ORF5 protein [Oligoflexales bacterium]
MVLKVYSIRDSKAQVFHPPFFQKTHGEAERSFKELANDNKNFIGKYPEDYDLYYLGEYDDNGGLLMPIDTPQHITKAVQVKDTQQ